MGAGCRPALRAAHRYSLRSRERTDPSRASIVAVSFADGPTQGPVCGRSRSDLSVDPDLPGQGDDRRPGGGSEQAL